MSDQDDTEKTEEPTQKRLDDALGKGDTPRSQELKHFFMLAGGALVIGMFGSALARTLQRDMLIYLEQGYAFQMDSGSVLLIWREVSERVLGALFMPLLLLMVAAAAGTLLQQRPVWAVEKLKPSFSKLSPMKGLARMFSVQSASELGKNVLKLVVVGAIVVYVVWPDRDRLDTLMQVDLAAMLAYVEDIVLKMFGAVAAIMALLGGGDYLYQRFEFMKKQRMSRQEIRDEHKQSDGDPLIKARVRQIRAERARGRMMAAVPGATVVIVNPTHYAVALKYEHEKMAAPVCVAKGLDNIALRIRAVAEENKVPVIENPVLARALYASAEIDREISPDNYKAVAEVISFVMRLKDKRKRAIR
ncbi:MAG: flagellar biosynthesis protein FlhB [Alphaproteobacteria bacterium]